MAGAPRPILARLSHLIGAKRRNPALLYLWRRTRRWLSWLFRHMSAFGLVSVWSSAAFAQAPFEVAHTFGGYTSSPAYGDEGPGDALVEAVDGNLYGTTAGGGTFN